MRKTSLPLHICLFFLCLALLWLALADGTAQAAHPVRLVIFYSSDTHGHVFEDKNTIGLNSLAALKKSEPGAILLDAGDFLNGAVAASFSQGEDIIRLMRLTGYDAATLGNHEFGYGSDILLARYAAASKPSPLPALPLISANIHCLGGATGQGDFLVDPGVILYRQGVSIGILALSTLEGQSPTGPQGQGFVQEAPARESAELMIKRLKSAGCDIIIGLTHLGSDEALPQSSLALDGLPGLDIVIDGHSHRLRDMPLAGGLHLFSPGAEGRAVGRLEIYYDKEAKSIACFKNSILSKEDLQREYPQLQPDASVSAALAALNDKIDAALYAIVGQLPKALGANRQSLRTGPTALGNFCAEAMRAAYGSDIALLNGGAIRGGLPQGPVSLRDMHGLFPYGGKLMEFEISGTELLEILEHGLHSLPGAWGGYLQMAGLELETRPDMPPGSRLAAARLSSGAAIKTDGRYRVAVNDYMAAGGDGYHCFVGKVPLRQSIDIRDAVIAKMQ